MGWGAPGCSCWEAVEWNGKCNSFEITQIFAALARSGLWAYHGIDPLGWSVGSGITSYNQHLLFIWPLLPFSVFTMPWKRLRSRFVILLCDLGWVTWFVRTIIFSAPVRLTWEVSEKTSLWKYVTGSVGVSFISPFSCSWDLLCGKVPPVLSFFCWQAFTPLCPGPSAWTGSDLALLPFLPCLSESSFPFSLWFPYS